MTLDPVHFDGIAQLARRIDHSVDDSDHRDLAETVFEEFLDPLHHDGRPIVEPLDEVKRRRVDVEAVALQDDPFESCHGIDSGTVNPTTFRNGLVLDIAQAAMSATPTDMDLHRSRTVVATVHSNDASVERDGEWETFDEGYSQGRVLHAPRVSRYEEAVVHALSLYLAESQHARDHADHVTDLLLLDGPVYPKGMLNWLDRHPELRDLVVEEETPRDVVRNYVRLVEEFVERDVPLAGFVKNLSTKAITRAVRESGTPAPWAHDAAFFSHVLERRERVDGETRRATDELTLTNWFVSRAGSDRVFAADGDELDLDRDLDPELYEVTFCIIYDPRDDLVYRAEAPYAFTRDAEVRDRIERKLLADVAVERGPPLAIGKADELARIRRDERGSLIEKLEDTFDSDEDSNYDAKRWEI